MLFCAFWRGYVKCCSVHFGVGYAKCDHVRSGSGDEKNSYDKSVAKNIFINLCCHPHGCEGENDLNC